MKKWLRFDSPKERRRFVLFFFLISFHTFSHFDANRIYKLASDIILVFPKCRYLCMCNIILKLSLAYALCL